MCKSSWAIMSLDNTLTQINSKKESGFGTGNWCLTRNLSTVNIMHTDSSILGRDVLTALTSCKCIDKTKGSENREAGKSRTKGFRSRVWLSQNVSGLYPHMSLHVYDQFPPYTMVSDVKRTNISIIYKLIFTWVRIKC